MSSAPERTQDEASRAADDDVLADRPGEDPAGEEPDLAARRRSRLRLATLLLALLALLLTIAVVVLAVRAGRRSSREQARADAVQAAEQQAINVTSLSSKNIDEGLKRIADGGTGDFKSEYDAQAARLKQAVTASSVTATSQVVDAAVVRADADHAVVLLVIDGTAANKAQPTPQARRYCMQLEMNRVDGRWLTSSLSILS